MFDSLIESIRQDPQPFIILALFILSEVLGSMDRFKSNSIFQLFITVMKTLVSKTKFGSVVTAPLPPATLPETPPVDPVATVTTVTTVEADSNPKDGSTK